MIGWACKLKTRIARCVIYAFTLTLVMSWLSEATTSIKAALLLMFNFLALLLVLPINTL